MNNPPPDETAHQDGRLMHELTVVNSQISRYVLRFLDADAGQAEPLSVADERALGERIAEVAAGLCARADRRQALGDSRLPVEDDVDDLRQITGDKTQMEQE